MPSDINVSLTSTPPLKINVPQKGSIEVKGAVYGTGGGSDASAVKIYGDQTIDGNKTFTGITAGITKSMVGLSNVDNTSDVNKPVSDAAQLVLDGKVDKIVGKVLSDQNYTLAEKDKLAAIVPSKLINGTNEVELGEDANLYLAENGGIVFDRNNTSINVGMGFHIRSGEGISIEPVDQSDSQNLITRGWYFNPDGSLTAPNNDYYYARAYIPLTDFPAEDTGFGLTTPDGVTHDFYYDYDGISGPGTPILVNPSTDSITDVANKTIDVLSASELFASIRWDSEYNVIWIYQNVAGEAGNQSNYSYGISLSSFAGGELSRIVFGDGTIQTTAPTSDLYLLDRAHHTGTQPYSTITGLGTLATQSGTFSGTSSGTNTGDQTITLGGDATGSGTSLVNVTLADTGVIAGEYNSDTTTITPFTIDSKGRITATDTPVTITPDWSSVMNTPTTLDGYNITDAVNVGETQTISGAKEFTLSPIAPRPTESNHVATKAYADDISAGIHVHEQVHVILTIDLATATGGTVAYTNGTDGVGAKLTVTGGSTIIAALNAECGTDADLVSGENGSRIIINGEADDKNWNGIYTISADRELTRAADFDSSVEMAGGDFVFVTHGTSYADTGWVLSEPVTSVGVSDVEFVQFSGQGSYDAGDGLHRDGTTFSVVGTTGRIVVGPSVDLATHGVAGTYQSITTDAYGRVTSGSNPTTLSGYGITDAATSSDLSSHVGDDARHLTSTQNTLIDGITVSSTEINRLSGISSNVQTQLDGKSSTSHVHSDATTLVAGFMSTGDKTKLDAINGSNTGDQTITLTGDVTGSGTGSFVTTLKQVGVAATYQSVTTDVHGRVVAGTNPTTLSGYGITDAAALTGATFSGNISATNLSGNNTGDQTISLTGDVTGTGTGSFVATLKNTGTAGTYNGSATSVTPFTTDAAGRISSTGSAITITPAWGSITSKPTTLSGFGITDAASATDLSNHIADNAKHLTSAQNTLIDGITATSAEINYLGGVSSNIQTQLNGKSATSHTHTNATTGIDGFMSAGDKTKLDAITGSNTGDQTITLTGDVTGSGTGSFTTTLKAVGAAGTYQSVTTDANGRVTAGTNPTTLAGYGITDAADNANTVIGLSLFL